MVAPPAPTADTVKLMLLVPTVIGREKGTAATPMLLEINETMKFDAAGGESISVMAPLAPVICKKEGESAMLEPTITIVVAGFNPGAVTVIVAEPCPKPYRLGGREGAV